MIQPARMASGSNGAASNGRFSVPRTLSQDSTSCDGSEPAPDGGAANEDFGDESSSRSRDVLGRCDSGLASDNGYTLGSTSRAASRGPSESASVPPTEASFGSAEACGLGGAGGSGSFEDGTTVGSYRGASATTGGATAALVHKRSKRALKALLESLAQGLEVCHGDWSTQVAQLESRAMARLERLPGRQLVEGAPTSAAVDRAVRSELLAVLQTGLSPTDRPARAPPAGIEPPPASKCAKLRAQS